MLIIDEAQHPLNGEAAMFALKAARDQLNSGEEQDGIRVVFIGFSRDKLPNLVLKNGQPFYRAQVSEFPRLSHDYDEFVTELQNCSYAAHNQFAIKDVEQAFKLVGRRSEMLTTFLSDTRVIMGGVGDLGELLREGALSHQQGFWNDYASACCSALSCR